MVLITDGIHGTDSVGVLGYLPFEPAKFQPAMNRLGMGSDWDCECNMIVLMFLLYIDLLLYLPGLPSGSGIPVFDRPILQRVVIVQIRGRCIAQFAFTDAVYTL